MTQITLEHISLGYQGTPILRDLDLLIPSGAFFSLIGKSGCGKTTLIKAIAGLLPIANGRILFDEKDTANTPVEHRQISVLFQDVRLFTHLSVRDNVAFGMKMQGVSRRERYEQASTLLAMVELAGYETRAVSELSGGQQQRVALARALAVKPRLLLLDEPFTSLDSELKTQMQRLVRRIHDEQSLTTLLVTHDIGEAMLLSDHIAILNEGIIACCDTPAGILQNPKGASYLSSWMQRIHAQAAVLQPPDVTGQL